MEEVKPEYRVQGILKEVRVLEQKIKDLKLIYEDKLTEKNDIINHHHKLMNLEQSQIKDIECLDLKLNIGGKIFYTDVATIISIPNTLFTRLLHEISGTLKSVGSDRVPEIYIECYPTSFCYVLEFLRAKTIDLSHMDIYHKRMLLKQAKFFEIDCLIDIVDSSLQAFVEKVKYKYLMLNNMLTNLTLKTSSLLNGLTNPFNKESIFVGALGSFTIDFDKHYLITQIRLRLDEKYSLDNNSSKKDIPIFKFGGSSTKFKIDKKDSDGFYCKVLSTPIRSNNVQFLAMSKPFAVCYLEIRQD